MAIKHKIILDKDSNFELEFELDNDIGGNSQSNSFTFHGEQFENYKDRPNLFPGSSNKLKFRGTWELEAFFDLIQKARNLYNQMPNY